MSPRRIAPNFNDLDSIFAMVDHLRLHLDRELENHDLTTTQVRALMFISRVSGTFEKACTASNLEAHLGLPKATNQHLVKRLKERGLVEEAPDDWGDRRRKRLCLTRNGEQVLGAGLETWKHATKQMIRVLEAPVLADLRRAAQTSRGSQQRLHRLLKVEHNADWKYHKGNLLVSED